MRVPDLVIDSREAAGAACVGCGPAAEAEAGELEAGELDAEGPAADEATVGEPGGGEPGSGEALAAWSIRRARLVSTSSARNLPDAAATGIGPAVGA
jgi:hypothetical protein